MSDEYSQIAVSKDNDDLAWVVPVGLERTIDAVVYSGFTDDGTVTVTELQTSDIKDIVGDK